MEDHVECIAYSWIQNSTVIVNANVVDRKDMENAYGKLVVWQYVITNIIEKIFFHIFLFFD